MTRSSRNRSFARNCVRWNKTPTGLQAQDLVNESSLNVLRHPIPAPCREEDSERAIDRERKWTDDHSSRQTPIETAIEKDPCLLPPSLNRALRESLHRSYLDKRKATEKSEINKRGEIRLDLCKFVQGVADERQFLRITVLPGVSSVIEVISNLPPLFSALRVLAKSMMSPRMTRAAYPMNRA